MSMEWDGNESFFDKRYGTSAGSIGRMRPPAPPPMPKVKPPKAADLTPHQLEEMMRRIAKEEILKILEDL